MNETYRWRAAQTSRLFQEFVNGLRPIWADQAARTIYQRYLDPHYSDDEKMHAAYNSQNQSLRNAEEGCKKAKEQRLLVEEASLAMERHFRSTKKSMQNAEYYWLQAIDNEKSALLQIQDIDTLIAQAYQIGT